MRLIYILVFLLVSLVDAQNTKKVYVLECSNNLEFAVSLENGKAWLFLPHKTINFKAEDSKRCNKFSDGKNFIGFKEDLAYLKLDSKTYHCQNNRKKAIWERVKLDGYDFRATGNESGWNLLISSNTLVYNGDYGVTKYRFENAIIQTNEKKKFTIYNAISSKHVLVLKLESKECKDTMSDDIYETTVTLEIDSKVLHGCGRALH